MRALELAGGRRRGRLNRSGKGGGYQLRRSADVARTGELFLHTHNSELHTVLDITAENIDDMKLLGRAWDRVPEIAARYHVDPDCLHDILDDYVRQLLIEGVAHEWRHIAAVFNADCLPTVNEDAA